MRLIVSNEIIHAKQFSFQQSSTPNNDGFNKKITDSVYCGLKNTQF